MQKVLIVTFILSLLVITAVASYLYYKPSNTDIKVNVGGVGDGEADSNVDDLGLPNSENQALQPTGTDSDTKTEEHDESSFNYDYVPMGGNMTAHIMDHSVSEVFGIHRMDIKVNEGVSNVAIAVHSHDTFHTAAPGIVYKYPHAEVENLAESQIDSIKYHFQVPKSWLASQGLTQEQINIYKWDEASQVWMKQKVSYDSEEASYYFYHVNLDSFGEFAISA